MISLNSIEKWNVLEEMNQTHAIRTNEHTQNVLFNTLAYRK